MTRKREQVYKRAAKRTTEETRKREKTKVRRVGDAPSCLCFLIPKLVMKCLC